MTDAATRFTVRSFDPTSGSVRITEIETESVESARATLELRGQLVLGVSAPSQRWPRLRWSSARFDAVLLCDEMRTLLFSGMSIVEAVDTLHEKEPAGYKRQLLFDLRTNLGEGKSMSTALERAKHAFSPLLVASVRANERSSGIVAALDEYIAYEKVGRELNRKIATAAIYPVVVAAFGMAVCLFMLGYVVPRFAHIYEDVAQAVSVPTQILMHVAKFFDAYFWWVLSGAVVLGLLLTVAYQRGILQSSLLAILARFRFARHYLRMYQLARLYQTMSMLLRGGFTLSDAMPMAQNMVLDPRLHAQVTHARARLMEGRRLSQVFEEAGLTDTVALRMLQVGERSGNLDHVMSVIAQTYRNDFALFIERATKVAEPVILMVTGLLIGALIILMYMPVFDLAGSL